MSLRHLFSSGLILFEQTWLCMNRLGLKYFLCYNLDTREPPRTLDRSTINGHMQSAAVLSTGGRCLVSRNGSFATVTCRHAFIYLSGLCWFWKCCRLHGPNGNRNGQACNARELPSPSNIVEYNFD